MGKKRKSPDDEALSASGALGRKAGAPSSTTSRTTVPSGQRLDGVPDEAGRHAHNMRTHTASSVSNSLSLASISHSLSASGAGKAKAKAKAKGTRIKHDPPHSPPQSVSSTTTTTLDSRPKKKSKKGHSSCVLLEGDTDDSKAPTTMLRTTTPATGPELADRPGSSSAAAPAGSWILGTGGTAATSKSAPARTDAQVLTSLPAKRVAPLTTSTASKHSRRPPHPSLPAKPPPPLPGPSYRSTPSACSPPSAPVKLLSPPSSARSPPTSSHIPFQHPPTSYVTASGTVLTVQNAGFVLSAYLQSFGHDPSRFKMSTSFTLVPAPTSLARSTPAGGPRPREPHQPPLDHLYHCTITLPHPCAIRSMTSPAPGLRSKDLAKKHASMELVWALIGLGQIGDDLKPLDWSRNKAKHFERIAEKIHRRTRDSLSPPDLGTPRRAAKTDSVKRAMLDQLPSLTPGNQVIPGLGEYPYIPRASFWDHCASLKRPRLWPTLFQLRPEGPYAHRTDECRTVCLLTSRPLPVFGDSGEFIQDMTMNNVGADRAKVPASVRLIRGRRMKEWEEGRLEQAMEYTLRLIRAHVNKPVHGDLESSKWLVLPMLSGWKVSEKVKWRDISWTEVEQATAGPLWFPFSFNDPDKLEQEIVDAMTTPRAEFSRRLFARRVRKDLDPRSPHPEDPSRTVLGWLPADVELTDPLQPLIEGDQVQTIRHGGFLAGLANPKLAGKVAIPEVIMRHCISASVFKTTSALPAALSLLDDLLVARDFSDRVFHSRLETSLALTALSCPTSHGHKAGRSYERLEMLGDTLLKLLVAVYFLYYIREDEIDWDEVHREKQIMVANRTLQSHAIKVGVVPFIRGANAQNRQWLPMGWVALVNPPNEERRREQAGRDMEGQREDVSAEADSSATAANVALAEGEASRMDKGDMKPPPADQDSIEVNGSSNAEPQLSPTHPDRLQSTAWSAKKLRANDPPPTIQQLGDKTIADVFEALVAASYLSENRHIDGAIGAMHILGMRLSCFKNWETVVTTAKAKNEALRAGAVEEKMGLVPLKVLGYDFAVGTNGRDALSLSHDPIRRARSLKFKVLGDAVIDYFLIGWLFDNHPTEGPGSLTVMRHSRRSDSCLAAYAVSSGLIDLLTDIPAELVAPIVQYKKAILAAEKKVVGVKGMGRWEFWADVKPVNYVADMVHALFGSILVDSNYDLAATRNVFERMMLPWLEDHCVGPGHTGPHPRTVWSEMIFGRGCRDWSMEKTERDLRDWKAVVYLHGQPIGRGESEAATLAVRRACEEAVKRCKGEGLLDSVCTCPRKTKKSRQADPAV